MKDPDRIILVYNAGNGLFNALNDWAHKVFSPATYDCRLCRFTYGLSGMLLPWKKFIESLPCPATFLHRPEFQKAYPDFETDFPAILIEREGQLSHLVSADEIAVLENLGELIEFTSDRYFEFTGELFFGVD